MAAKTEKNKKPTGRYWHSELKYRDIKRMAVERGMPFPEVVSSDFYGLVSFIDSEESKKPDPSLVLQFDLWLEGILKERGADYLIKPSLRLSYISDDMRQGAKEKKPAKEKVVKEKKIREKDGNNLVKGTKKSYTFKLAKAGFSLERVKRRVLKKFPDASEKSIIIWYRKALDIKFIPKPKEKKERVKKEKTPEQIALQKERAKQRKQERALSRKKANERREEYLKKTKKNGKGKTKKRV